MKVKMPVWLYGLLLVDLADLVLLIGGAVRRLGAAGMAGGGVAVRPDAEPVGVALLGKQARRGG